LCKGSWFFENCNGAKLHGLRGRFSFRVGAEDDDREVGMTGANLDQQGDATEARHDEVHEDSGHRRRLKDIKRLGAVEGYQHLMPGRSDGLGQELGHRGFVFHHEDSHDCRSITILTGPHRSSQKLSRQS